jgi:hypothetical protein
LDSVVFDVAVATRDTVTQLIVDARAGQTLALLALVAGQDVEPAEGSGASPPSTPGAAHAQDRPPPPGRLQRHVAIEPDTGLFTAGELTKAIGGDNHETVVGLSLLDRETAEPGGPAEPVGAL